MSASERNQDAPPTPEGSLLEAWPAGDDVKSTDQQNGNTDKSEHDSDNGTPSGEQPRKNSQVDETPNKEIKTENEAPPDGLVRQNSKVRFDSTDDSTKDESSSEDERPCPPVMPLDSHAPKNLNIRRTSLSALSHHSQQQEVHLAHPRKRVSAAFESLDYNAVESQSFVKQQMFMNPRVVKRLSMMRWFINFAVGVYVAVIAVLVWLLIKYISMGKFMAIYKIMEKCSSFGCTIGALVVWLLFNCFFTFIGSYLVTFHAPSAAGSGIPQVKCYLNGIRMPGLMSLRTLLAKAGGVVLSVCGGLACGKEGPMIHSGAICASSLASGHFNVGKKSCDPSCCNGLRSDDERRDFVAAGAASGVSAAFASPVGGVLFALEEGASFVKQELTWRMLFSSMVAGLFLNMLMSAIKGHPEDMSSPGLVSFGYLGDIEFKTFEIPIFIVMGIFGGLLGALFVQINYHITIFRRKKIKKPWLKVGEACLVAATSAVLLHVLIFAFPNCAPVVSHNDQLPNYVIDENHPPSDTIMATGNYETLPAEYGAEGHPVHRRSASVGGSEYGVHSVVYGTSSNETKEDDIYGWHGHGYIFQDNDDDDDDELDSMSGREELPSCLGLCPYGEHNRMADILFKTPEGGLHAMLHEDKDHWTIGTLVGVVVFYHLLTTWTYGLNVSSGLFIPSLLIGAVWGRIVGILVMSYVPSVGTNIGKYALVGAAAQLGGFVRMTISLTVIIIECTGDITFGLPIIITLIVAKWMGDFFNPGIYDLHIEIWGAPLLGWEPPEKTYGVIAKEVMSTPVVVLRTMETFGRIKEIVDDPTSHNGYPIVDEYDPTDTMSKTSGLLRGFILKKQLKRILQERAEDADDDEEISLNEIIPLKEHMDISPHSVQEDVSLPRIFKLFRSLGLRHLVVVNERNRVVGMITRINVARFRSEMVKGKFHIEELEVVED
ncbi:hypothetical protein LSH36_781g02019 [Paralvinella palmiformis]|uniref:Chloride channel protein n=1 Tax=Paralvinella palmiformis TaxID=53620 RepID=A0AAD9MSH7_9ANNE|nr:hypothetical protein LSH36_781g02019 [Paralvinella palmiformis]